MLAFFQLHKTYIVAFIAALFNLLVATNAVSAAHLVEINVILAAFGVSAFHADTVALAKLNK